MILQSSLKVTIGHVADSVFLGRDSNWDPDHYRANWIHDSNNVNFNNNLDNLINLGGGSFYHVFRCGSRCCQF